MRNKKINSNVKFWNERRAQVVAYYLEIEMGKRLQSEKFMRAGKTAEAQLMVEHENQAAIMGFKIRYMPLKDFIDFWNRKQNIYHIYGEYSAVRGPIAV